MEFNEKLHRRIRWPAVLHILLPLLAAFTALMVVGRLISGMHWLSDIIGSILLSAGLVLLYAGCQNCGEENEPDSSFCVKCGSQL